MSVETLVTYAESVGNAVTLNFTLPFYFIDNNHVVVTLNGVVQASGYFVTGARVPSGGTVTFFVAPGSGVIVGRRRVVPLTQPVDTQNNQTIFEDVFDDGLDRATMQIQQIGALANRAIVAPEGEDSLDMELPAADVRADYILSFDPITGEPITTLSAGEVEAAISAALGGSLTVYGTAASAITLAAAKALFGALVVVPNRALMYVATRSVVGDLYAGLFVYDSSDAVSTYTYDALGFVDSQNRRWKRVLGDYISVNWTGCATDLTADAAPHLRVAMNAAVSNTLRKVFFKGQLRLDTKVYAGEACPQGVKLQGIGPVTSTVTPPAATEGSLLKYTGVGYVFDFREANGTTQIEGPRFADMVCWASDGAGGFFSLNYLNLVGTDYVPTDDATTPYYVRGIEFDNVFGIGARAAAAQTADFIRAKKCFELEIKPNCRAINWRRGVNGVGIDNATIAGRYLGNTQHIHLEASSTFGNHAKIEHPFLGVTGAGAADSETRYGVYDSARTTKLFQPDMEDTNGAAYLYLNGIGFSAIEPNFSPDIVPWRLGPNAIQTVVYRPQGVNGTFTIAPVYDSAASLDSGKGRVQVIAPSYDFMGALLPHPRQHIIAPETNYAVQTEYLAGKNLIDSLGCRQQRYDISVLDFDGQTTSGGFADDMVINTDALAPMGYAFKMPGASASGFLKRYQLGKHFFPGDTPQFTVSLRGAGSTVRLQIINGDGSAAVTSDVNPGAAYGRFQISAAPTGVLGDTIGFRVAEIAASDAFFGGGTVELVTANIADPTGGATVDAQSRTAIVAILTALRGGKKLAG